MSQIFQLGDRISLSGVIISKSLILQTFPTDFLFFPESGLVMLCLSATKRNNTMRKLSLFMNVSLDGYFEAPGHDLSGFTNDFEAFPSQPDQQAATLLFGHRTYDMMKAFWPTPQALEMVPEVAKFMNSSLKLVASHNPFNPGWNNVQVINADVIAQVRQIKEQPGGTIMIFGSNILCVSLIQAGLIDEFQIVVNPVLFGGGTSLFYGLPGRLPLTLKETRQLKSGAILLTYKPLPFSEPRTVSAALF
jgi:dihydrofolate reductase